jgi:hypothetical protein
MTDLRYTDIFVPGGFPRHTYNPRLSLQLEKNVAQVKDNLCKLVTVTGHTKSGKTVLVRRILPREEAVWVDGGGIDSEETFWQVVLEQLDLPQTVQFEAGREHTTELNASASTQGNFFFFRGEAKLGGGLKGKRGTSTKRTRSVSSRVSAVNGLRINHRPLVIDDFHYIPRDLQGALVRILKPLIFDGLPVVIIAIPHRRYDAMKVEKEMTGRILQIEIPSWTEDELRFIPDKGFHLLNIDLPSSIIDRLSHESIGSPHLMQDFCRGIGKLTASVSSGAQAQPTFEESVLNQIFNNIAETIGRPIFDKLARGPRQRTDRITRTLKAGTEVDIYELVLHALAYLRPGLITLEYEDLRTAIKDVSAQGTPQLHEVARVLKHMSDIASTDQSSSPVIDFDDNEKILHITDPFFAFYLRWGKIN